MIRALREALRFTSDEALALPEEDSSASQRAGDCRVAKRLGELHGRENTNAIVRVMRVGFAPLPPSRATSTRQIAPFVAECPERKPSLG